MQEKLTEILDKTKSYLPTADLEKIERAFKFSEKAHEGQRRFSGEPYFVHPVEATLELLTLEPDEDTIVACLLHDVIEDTETDLAEIEKQFGHVVAELCLGMEKLGTVRYSGVERQIENLRKMFVAMARDIRVIFIKLADRIHNMQTLEHVRPDKQKRIATETLEVYAPIAARLGVFGFKKKLEDLAFQYLHPEEYKRVKKELAGSEKSRAKMIESAKKKIKTILKKNGVDADVAGRTKHLYSIWRKLELKGLSSVDDVYDLFALRVFVPTTADCYTTLGILHANFTPLSRRFKDFIAVPKPNGYQSLHTTVIGLGGAQPTEIQIRTPEMHAQAEHGAAAHWQYSEKKKSVVAGEDKLGWIRGLVELHEELRDNSEFAGQLASDVLSDRIFVLTPQGNVLDLPAGATPIDFAYAIHTEVGHSTVGAKIDGKIAQLSSELRNGQVVEILTKKGHTPNRFWLSFVKTGGAKSHIKSYFNSLDREENIAAGKEIVNRQLARLGQPKLDSEYSLLRDYKKRDLGLRDREGILERIGNGSVAGSAVLRHVLDFDKLGLTFNEPRKKIPLVAAPQKISSDEVVIEGESGIETRLAKCCKPRPGQKIVAVVGRRGALIHREDCKQVVRVKPESKLEARFASDPEPRIVALEIFSRERVGLFRDIAAVISSLGLMIADISSKRKNKREIHTEITIEVERIEDIEEIFTRLESVEGVERVIRRS